MAAIVGLTPVEEIIFYLIIKEYNRSTSNTRESFILFKIAIEKGVFPSKCGIFLFYLINLLHLVVEFIENTKC